MSAIVDRIRAEHRLDTVQGCICGTKHTGGKGWWSKHIAEVTEAAILSSFEVYERDHFCTPACDDGCDIGRHRTWTRTEIIARREPMTDEEIAELKALLPRGGESR